MQFGPMTEIDINALKVLLDKAGEKYSILVSSEDIENANRYRSSKPVARYAFYDGNDTCLYLEINDSAYSILRHELENRGLIDNFEDVPKLQTEYVCTDCDFISGEPGKCPTHQLELLESSYNPEMQIITRSTPHDGALLVVAFLVFIAGVYAVGYFILK